MTSLDSPSIVRGGSETTGALRRLVGDAQRETRALVREPGVPDRGSDAPVARDSPTHPAPEPDGPPGAVPSIASAPSLDPRVPDVAVPGIASVPPLRPTVPAAAPSLDPRAYDVAVPVLVSGSRRLSRMLARRLRGRL
jgi:hypothetical protein